MTTINPDFADLLNCLNSVGARYLVLGGYAVNFYGFQRNTKDLDIWISTDAENAKRVVKALTKFGFSSRYVKSTMFQKKGAVYTFGREPMRVDLLTDPSAVDFENCYPRRIGGKIDGVTVQVIALDDLLVNKSASGRPQDMADLKKLLKLKSTKKKRSKK